MCVCGWRQEGEINGKMGLKGSEMTEENGSIGVTLMGTELCCELNELIFERLLCIFSFIERIAILTSCSLCEVKAISDDDWVWETFWWENRAHCIHITISHHIGICGSLPLTPARIEELAQRKVNRWLNSNGLCHRTFYQWESNSRAVLEFQFSFRLRYVPAFYSLHLYAS